MNFMSDMQDAAHDYAADLRKRGYLDVAVFRYDTYLDSDDDSFRSAFGWAVRYTSSAAMDEQVWQGTDGQRKGLPAPKFHDRSVTVFTADPGLVSADDWLTQDMLTRNGGILADVAGEDVAPMWTAAWSPSADTPGVRPENIPHIPSVIVKRFPVRANSHGYSWRIGPRRFYHLAMTPDTTGL